MRTKLVGFVLVSKSILRELALAGDESDILAFWIDEQVAMPSANGAVAAIYSL